LVFGALAAVWIVIYTGFTKQNVETFFGSMMLGKLTFPWRTLFASLFALIFLTIFIQSLMPYYHILGTSKVGEDVLYQSIKSIRTGFLIGTLTTLFMLPLAITLGLM